MVYSTIIVFNAIWFQGFDGLAGLLHPFYIVLKLLAITEITGILSYHTLTQNFPHEVLLTSWMNFHWLVHLSILTNK